MPDTQDESEGERARLWYSAACNSTSPQQQLTAFKNAINTLTVGLPVHTCIHMYNYSLCMYNVHNMYVHVNTLACFHTES